MLEIIQEEYNEQGKELREHGTAAFPIACYHGDWREVSVPLHWHSELEAGLVTAGQVTMLIGPEKVCLNRGDGFFINSGIPHAVLCADGQESRQCSVVFDPILVGGRPGSLFWQRYVQPVLSAASMPYFCFRAEEGWQEKGSRLIQSVWEHCVRTPEDYELEVRDALSRLLSLLKDHVPNERPAQDRRIARDNARVRTMMGYIQTHYQETVSIEDIAASAVISVSEALRCFHNTIGLTPVQYLKSYRIQQAAAELLNSDRKISEIGAACGFQEMSYFAKAFRETMGMTPSAYRKKHRQ